jgi:hypothetical protein
MESQLLIQLPEVREESEGAAPDELIIYYCDMFPFQMVASDASTRIPRTVVANYFQTELVPAMVDAFRVQADDWGFAWSKAWASVRGSEHPERLSVALTAGSTYYHGPSPAIGHSGISINIISEHNARYDSLTDAIASVFHHELFHNLQQSIDQSSGGDGDLGGRRGVWQFFTEGTAVLAAAVGNLEVEFTQSTEGRHFAQRANSYLLLGRYNSYARMSPYDASLYWRFLYEHCGGMREGSEDSAAGMEVIEHALTALYSGVIVDAHSSSDIVGHFPAILDLALEDTSCPFATHEDSLVQFGRAIYALRLQGGRCTAPGLPSGCALYDPHGLYRTPTARAITYTGAYQEHPAQVSRSYGIGFIEVAIDPVADGQTLALEFIPAPGTEARLNVQVWKLIETEPGARSRAVPEQDAGPEAVGTTHPDRSITYVIPSIDVSEFNLLGLIITRVDASERADPIGSYKIVLRPAG